MRSHNKKLTLIDSLILSEWAFFAMAGIGLLLIDFFILPLLLNSKAVQPLVLPIIQTICQYSALFLGIVALIKVINANFFNNDASQTEKK